MGSAPTSAPTITIKGYAFNPATTTVPPGATVTVTNMDQVAHTVNSDVIGTFAVNVPSGGTTTFTAPTNPGSYPYHCAIHPYMHGSLVVS